MHLMYGEITCSDWRRHVTFQSIILSVILFTKEQQKKTLKSRKNLTNSVNYELDNEQSESEFY